MSAFIVCPGCEGHGKRQTKAGKDWFACETCKGNRVVAAPTLVPDAPVLVPCGVCQGWKGRHEPLCPAGNVVVPHAALTAALAGINHAIEQEGVQYVEQQHLDALTTARTETKPCFWCRSAGPCRHDPLWRADTPVSALDELELDHDLQQATLIRLRESIRKHQRALRDLLPDVADALRELDHDSLLYSRVQAFMDIEPNDENFEIVSPEILDLIERALAGSAQSDHALADDDERRVDDWLREMRRLLP